MKLYAVVVGGPRISTAGAYGELMKISVDWARGDDN